MKKDDGFNTPFTALKKYKVKPKEPKIRKTSAKKANIKTTDRDFFIGAMQDVTPLAPNDRVALNPDAAARKNTPGAARNDDLEVLQELKALVKGTARFDITATGEYVEGHAIPIDPQTMRKLKNGDFSVQAHLDLHGMDRQAARLSVGRFIINAHAVGDRSLLIIHGRGLSSQEGPVLKKSVMKWISTGELAHLVLAFCSARPCDGGTGAIYVLLKKRPLKSRWSRPAE